MIRVAPTPYSALVTARIEQAERTVNAIVTLSPDGVTGTLRDHICAALSSVAPEHLRAILMLVKSQECVGSAFSLLRALAETVVRSEWLLLCALPSEYEAILDETGRFPKFESMAKAVDLKQIGKGYLTGFTGAVYGKLCGFTHSGLEQIQHRFAADEAIEPNYSEIQIASLVLQSTFLVFQHFVLNYDRKGLDLIAQGILSAAGDFGEISVEDRPQVIARPT